MTPPRRAAKSDAAFRTISEVSAELDVAQHVLRFWESRFPQIKPLKRGGGRRYYRPEDTQLLRRIRDLLYREGYTIKGVQKLLKEGAIPPPGPGDLFAPSTPTPDKARTTGNRAEIERIIGELESMLAALAAGRRS